MPRKAETSFLILSIFLASCSQDSDLPESSCVEGPLEQVAGASGQAYVFNSDPISASGNPTLSPSSLDLNPYREEVGLSNLGGRGVLEGKYVDIRNGLGCDEGFGAFSFENQFLYEHRDPGFQEAMSYYFGDEYRHFLDQSSVLQPVLPVKIVANCMFADNAYYFRGFGAGGEVIEKVCLGNSVATLGAFYADDASVVVHELQHATTTNTYSQNQSLNQFWYDEAGALNEAVSDFMSLLFLENSVPDHLDPKLFGRWALGTFFPGFVGTRGAHRCPVYDSDYPLCRNYDSGASGFSAEQNTLSYVYPDGVGWPYPNNFSAPGYLRSAFLEYSAQEEIHNTGIVVISALWDVFDYLKQSHSGEASKRLISQLVMKGIEQLPKPSAALVSPVSFRGFAQKLVDWAPVLGWSSSDQDQLKSILTDRGLYEGATLTSGWADVGPGSSAAPGVRIIDNPSQLKSWLLLSGRNGNAVTQGIDTGLNSKLDPGEFVAIWFDLRNNSTLSAGGVTLQIQSLNSKATFPGFPYNDGYVSNQQTQIQYYKVNGTDVVSSLSSGNSTFHVPTGNTYFRTNPYFDHTWKTAVWIKLDSSAQSGETIPLEVKAIPSNGVSETVTFTVVTN